jgi:dienelactone hydrolase
VITDVPGDPVSGYLAKPDGEGTRPAVVALHGCAGLGASRMQDVADELVSWGYVALFVDSFTRRGVVHTCTRTTYSNHKEVVSKRPLDAFGALIFLAAQPFVDSRRIAVLGFSQGAEMALKITEERPFQIFTNPDNLAFRAAVAFYPPCRRAGGRPAIPTLIAIGELDDWTPAQDCERLVARWGERVTPVQLAIYPGAYHAFNAPVFDPGQRMFGHWLEYHREAARKAYLDTRSFLGRHLGN